MDNLTRLSEVLKLMLFLFLFPEALGTEGGSSWSSEGQTSPPSSCATPNSATDVPDSELTFTVGATDATPYSCHFCTKAFPRLSYLKKHEQVSCFKRWSIF